MPDLGWLVIHDGHLKAMLARAATEDPDILTIECVVNAATDGENVEGQGPVWVLEVSEFQRALREVAAGLEPTDVLDRIRSESSTETVN